MRRSDSSVSFYTLQKETEDSPKEGKRPTEVFRAGPWYTGMGLSWGSGTYLLATVTAAEAQAVEPQLSSWPPPCPEEEIPQLGRNGWHSKEVTCTSAGCWALVLRLEIRGMGGAHAHCRGRTEFAQKWESMDVSKPPFHLSAEFPRR